VKVRYRSRALRDIESIHSYVSERNPRAAKDIVTRIRCASDRLGHWPYIGHTGFVPETHEWCVVGLPHVIVYEVDEAADETTIIAAFHAAHDRTRSD